MVQRKLAYTDVNGRKRRQSSTMLNFQGQRKTNAGIPANLEGVPRSPRADALFCSGDARDVYDGLEAEIEACCQVTGRCICRLA